jgi:uncharacterized membrane protein YfcA
MMTQNTSPHDRFFREGFVTALAVGGFFIILGLVLALTPDISNQTRLFFSDIQTITYPYGNSGSTINLPAPANPAAHTGFYTAVMYFALGVGVLQVLVLALRLSIKSPVRRVSQTVGDLIFWLGAAVLVNVFLLPGASIGWLNFWSTLIILIGVSLIARFFIHLARRKF